MTARYRRTRYTVYDAAHCRARDKAVAAYIPGQPCAIGGEPLWQHPHYLDLAHNADHTGYLGLACWTHNRAEAARRKNRMQAWLRHPERYATVPAAAPFQPSRDW